MEMTASGVLTGLKSWLNFGSNIGANTVIIILRRGEERRGEERRGEERRGEERRGEERRGEERRGEQRSGVE
jgi:hypothetical protein